MSKLIITRSSEWTNKMRKIGLYLNESKIGTIADGETKEFEIEPGNYNLRAKIDWCGSQTLNFTLEPEESKKVELKSFTKGSMLFPLMLLTIIAGFIADYYFNFDFLIMVSIVTIPAFLYLLYFLTIGRHKYLQLELYK